MATYRTLPLLLLLPAVSQAQALEHTQLQSIDISLRLAAPQLECREEPTLASQYADSVLCQPDPFWKVCNNRSQEAVEHEKRLKAKTAKMSDQVGRLLKQGVARAEALKLDEDVNNGLRKDLGAVFRYAWDHVRNEYTKDTRSQVDANVQKALATFRRTVGKSKLLSPSQLKTLDQVLANCFEKKPAILDLDLSVRNAAVHRRISAQLGFPLKDGQFPDPVAQSATETCGLSLSGMEWLECAEGTPECFSVLFHEFGHAINACGFMSVSALASAGSKGMDDKAAKSIAFRVRNSGVFDSTRLPPSSKFKLEVISQLATTEQFSYQLGEALIHSSSCLGSLSDPKDGIRNSCPSELELPEPIVSHCGFGSAEGFPSQWDEAEADFWGASAFADWLTETHGTIPARQAAARSAIEAWCVEGMHGNHPATPEEAAQLRKKAVDEFMKGLGTENEAIRDILDSHMGGRKLSDCEKKPSVQGVKPWMDPHQEWSFRVNNNLYRNLDLRAALGCRVSGPEIVLGCSPLRDGTLLVPR